MLLSLGLEYRHNTMNMMMGPGIGMVLFQPPWSVRFARVLFVLVIVVAAFGVIFAPHKRQGRHNLFQVVVIIVGTTTTSDAAALTKIAVLHGFHLSRYQLLQFFAA